MALIETARGVDRITEIAWAGKRLTIKAFGAVNDSLDIGTSLSGSGLELSYVRSRVVTGCRVGDLHQPIDTVQPDYRNDRGPRDECKLAKCPWYHGKMIIHPCQVDIVHDVFTPEPGEVLYAHCIVKSFEDAEEGKAWLR